MENVGKKEEGVPKSTPSSPSMGIHRDSRTISKFYTRRTKTTRVERFQDLFTTHNDPNSSTSTPPPPPPPLPSPPPPVLFDQQEVVTEEEKTYYVDWNEYHDWPGFFKDLREAINDGFFDDIMINPEKDPNKKVQQEKLPDTQSSESVIADKVQEKLPDTQSSESVTADKVQEKLPDTQSSESVIADKVQEKLPDTQSSESVTANKVQEKLPDTQSSEFVTADKGTSPFESLKKQSHFETAHPANKLLNSVSPKDYASRISGADYFSIPKVSKSSSSAAVGTRDTDIRDSGFLQNLLYWQANLIDPGKTRDKTTEIEEYQEKSYMSKYGIYGSIPTGTETIDPRGEESMHHRPVPALISGMATASEGLQENTAEVQKQALPVESPGKFHKIMYGIWQRHSEK
ncbi:uncharacterized protein LOC120003542 [Tripterygium wilfordii]|uniref:uncharacterized protein LOC120003542 n=1 Tax=Tripterygium wilfordii TaxID=458696 RepID=UPI0018F7F28B|nr:uncharacterized protein LOC120003542 [Tripterygium wilfordii]